MHSQRIEYTLLEFMDLDGKLHVASVKWARTERKEYYVDVEDVDDLKGDLHD